jgi:hypothetical protein
MLNSLLGISASSSDLVLKRRENIYLETRAGVGDVGAFLIDDSSPGEVDNVVTTQRRVAVLNCGRKCKSLRPRESDWKLCLETGQCLPVWLEGP